MSRNRRSDWAPSPAPPYPLRWRSGRGRGGGAHDQRLARSSGRVWPLALGTGPAGRGEGRRRRPPFASPARAGSGAGLGVPGVEVKGRTGSVTLGGRAGPCAPRGLGRARGSVLRAGLLMPTAVLLWGLLDAGRPARPRPPRGRGRRVGAGESGPRVAVRPRVVLVQHEE